MVLMPRRRQYGRVAFATTAAVVGAVVAQMCLGGPTVHASLIPPPGTPVATLDDPLPVDLSAGNGDDRLVFSHYFTAFPISIDNKASESDYYTKQYLDPRGEKDRYAAVGGLMRHRPLPRDPIDSSDWQLQDMRTEIARARSAGIDGFTVDLLAIDGYHWDRVQTLVEAANEVAPDFKLMLMPDATTRTVSDPVALAAAIASLADEPSVHRLDDGRLVIAPFAAERQSPSWWADWLGLMSSEHGIETAFVPLFVDFWSNVDEFASISYGVSTGARGSPATNVNIAEPIERAASLGKLWMQPISVQDSRPRRSTFDEANNSENLRLTWQAAIDAQVPWVHLFSWNDYAEHTVFAPSTDTGWSALDISSYYVEWYRTGMQPTIARDALYVSHRIQPAAAVPTGGQTSLMEVRDSSDPPRDTVEVLSFFTAPMDVTVTVGTSTYTYSAPAGVHAELFPLELGFVTASFAYPSGVTVEVASPYEVVAAPVLQNLLYHYVSSAREGAFTGLVAPPTTSPSTDLAPPDTSDGLSTDPSGGDDSGRDDSGEGDDDGSSSAIVLAIGAGMALMFVGLLVLVRHRRTTDQPSRGSH